MSDREEWQNALRKMKLMDETDTIEKEVMARWFMLSIPQRKGICFFTNKRFVFVSSFGTYSFSVAYKDIKYIGKCKAGIFPIGMYVVAKSEKKARIEKYRVLVIRRDKWLRLLSEKSGVAIE